MVSFSAALLAGGQSKRMGYDKALIRDPVSGQLLWQRQLRLLEELQPEEILWSGPPRPGLSDEVRIVEDAVPQAGPLAGIGACLNVARSDLLVVLAVDMPRMNATFLRSLLTTCTPGCGAVAKQGLYYEPLAAVYPRTMRTLTETHLSQGRHALQDLLSAAERNGMIHSIQLEDGERSLFKNVNTPDDI